MPNEKVSVDGQRKLESIKLAFKRWDTPGIEVSIKRRVQNRVTSSCHVACDVWVFMSNVRTVIGKALQDYKKNLLLVGLLSNSSMGPLPIVWPHA